jgi:peptidoglycan/LPS O-acetylase OafA/YrhL
MKSDNDSRNVVAGPQQIKEDYLPFLDGFRGLAALWVVACHSLILSGSTLPILIRGDIAVEIFMIMSGFLMTYHYYMRQQKEPWEEPKTWFKFYVRPFFRIAPLYYVLLLVYFFVAPQLGVLRQEIGQTYIGALNTDFVRYTDQGLWNIFLHVSFLFGFFPDYVARSPMPDWSIALEMQFYLVFPFLMYFFRKNYFLVSTFVIVASCVVINKIFISHVFVNKAFLTTHLKLFLIGMILAVGHQYKTKNISGSILAMATALFLAGFAGGGKIIQLATFLLVLLLNINEVERFFGMKTGITFLYKALSNSLTTWLADMSYCVYLIHFLFLIPIAHFYSHIDSYLHLPGILRFLIVFITACVPTYLASFVLFNIVEKNGILFGKSLVKKI